MLVGNLSADGTKVCLSSRDDGDVEDLGSLGQSGRVACHRREVEQVTFQLGLDVTLKED